MGAIEGALGSGVLQPPSWASATFLPRLNRLRSPSYDGQELVVPERQALAGELTLRVPKIFHKRRLKLVAPVCAVLPRLKHAAPVRHPAVFRH